MIKKQLLVILATIVLSFSAFAQFSGGDGTENNPYLISTKDDLLEIDDNDTYRSMYFKQTADIDLGDLGTLPTNEAIINGTFSGTYDGGGHSISYSVKFEGSVAKESFGLFEKVSGTIKNLRITSSSAMLTGAGPDMNVGLICGVLLSGGVITDCHVTGDINSTVNPGEGAGSDAGLIVGQSLGKIKYSSGTGNVVGVGYAGGLVGQLNDRWGHFSDVTTNGEIIGCSFVGSVTALKPSGNYNLNNDLGNFAGGICGLVYNGGANPEISLSYANATVVSDGGRAYGLAHFSNNNGTISNIYVKGTVNDDNIDTNGEISNLDSGNRYDNTNHNTVEINSTLNGVVDNTNEANEKIYFSRETGEIILVFGRPSQDEDLGDDYIDNEDEVVSVCEPLQGAIEFERKESWYWGNGRYNRYYRFYASWPSNRGDVWYWVLKRDDGTEVTHGTKDHSDNLNKVEVEVGNTRDNINDDEYIFSVSRVCSQTDTSLYTYESFVVDDSYLHDNYTCYSVLNLAVSYITTNSAVVSWNIAGNSQNTITNCKYRISGGNYTDISSNTGNYSVTLTGLEDNTTYTIEVNAHCNNGDSKSELIEFKTAKIIINNSCDRPTGLHILETTVGGVKEYTAKWNAVQGATWEYLFKNSDGDTIASGITPENSVLLGEDGANGLANGEYVFSVRRLCDEVDNTLNRYETCLINIEFTCTSITGLSVSSITANSAVVDWQGTSGSSYQFKLNEQQAETLTTTQKVLTGLDPNTLYTIEIRKICSDGSLSPVEIIQFKTKQVASQVPFKTVKDGNFEQPSTWNRNSVPTGNNEGTITIKHEVVLNSTLTLNGNTTINIDHSGVNKGVLIIDQQGQLINKTTEDVNGIVEVKTPIKKINQWTFIGAPFVENSSNQYKLEILKPVTGCDIVITGYDFNAGDWGADNDDDPSYLYVNNYVGTGEGYMGFLFYDGVVTFTTYGDLWDYTNGRMNTYDNTTPKYKLNNNDFTLTKTVCTTPNSGHYLPLSNPYPAKLSVNKFLADNAAVQGLCVYRLNNNTREWQTLFDDATEAKGEILITEGFFVNFSTSGAKTITFKKEHMTNYPTTSSKSAVEREFIELSLVQNNHASKLYFAHNEQAEQGYDIFDADKLFAMTEMTEPYFVTEGIALVKEEVAELPYYATMNVRSFEHDSVSFVANNIPEGYSVSIIDGEETIELTENSAYSTLVSAGENANRFKVLIKKSVGLGEVEELEVEITNSNRLVNVSSTEEDLQIEVYNALGQKVFATKERNFTLNNVSAGAYVVKAFNNKASKTQKIVIK
jgi:hypothetical protein